jgi:hypothetical protein
VAAIAANDVWAVGQHANNHESLVLHWDGQGWHPVRTATAGIADRFFYGLSALDRTRIWAVGESSDIPADTRLLAEEYTGPPEFSDVPPSQPFYPYVHCLAWYGVVNGYADCTYRPGADVTRGQLAKILANAADYADEVLPTQQTFADVPPSQPFWLWVERLAAHGAISGYACGGPGEPCDGQNRVYFRPGAPSTRGQIAKIAAAAAALVDPIPTTQQTFADVPPTNAFWQWVERLAGRGVISGYTCGGPGEPCDGQQRPYFRWGGNTTRGQMAKIAAQTFYPNCQIPARRGMGGI